MYIYQNEGWPHFTYDENAVVPLLEDCHFQQGRLISRMELLGLAEKEDKLLSTITSDIIKSSEIEGYVLNKDQVRSSVARRLGIQKEGMISSGRDIDAVVEMMMDATGNYKEKLTEERLFGWHACLFPTGYSGMYRIDVGKYRSSPMQVVSGGIGQEKVHYEAPDASRVGEEMKLFIDWFNNASGDSMIKAAIAHLWFVTIHPFDDGNGRITRTLSDMLLCRSDRTHLRFYSMSSEIMADRNNYYNILEKTQKGSLDITGWIVWFLNCILKALASSFEQIEQVLKKYRYLDSFKSITMNERQKLLLQKLTDGSWFGTLNTSKWAKIAKCSTDTALRDINDLVEKGILKKEPTSGGRSTNYVLCQDREE